MGEEESDRRAGVLRGIDKNMLGIEVGPWFAPLAPKRDGYRVLTLDVFDRERLLENARTDANVPADSHDLIEDVDLVGSATDLANLVAAKGLSGQIDYILSSHNFEHLPNPILFLRGCQNVLRSGGLLSMAIPDRRAMFDFFRPVATTADFLDAFVAERDRPSAASRFEQACSAAEMTTRGETYPWWDVDEYVGAAQSTTDIDAAYAQFQAMAAQSHPDYVDVHVSVFTRSSFELIIRELHYLGIIELGVERISRTNGFEFYAQLRKGLPVPSKSAFYETRATLLNEIVDEGADGSRKVVELEQRIKDKEAQIAAMRGSWSWKMMEPLRWAQRRIGVRSVTEAAP